MVSMVDRSTPMVSATEDGLSPNCRSRSAYSMFLPVKGFLSLGQETLHWGQAQLSRRRCVQRLPWYRMWWTSCWSKKTGDRFWRERRLIEMVAFVMAWDWFHGRPMTRDWFHGRRLCCCNFLLLWVFLFFLLFVRFFSKWMLTAEIHCTVIRTTLQLIWHSNAFRL